MALSCTTVKNEHETDNDNSKKLKYNSAESTMDKYTLMLYYCKIVTAANDTDSCFCYNDQEDRSVLS